MIRDVIDETDDEKLSLGDSAPTVPESISIHSGASDEDTIVGNENAGDRVSELLNTVNAVQNKANELYKQIDILTHHVEKLNEKNLALKEENLALKDEISSLKRQERRSDLFSGQKRASPDLDSSDSFVSRPKRSGR